MNTLQAIFSGTDKWVYTYAMPRTVPPFITMEPVYTQQQQCTATLLYATTTFSVSRFLYKINTGNPCLYTLIDMDDHPIGYLTMSNWKADKQCFLLPNNDTFGPQQGKLDPNYRTLDSIFSEETKNMKWLLTDLSSDAIKNLLTPYPEDCGLFQTFTSISRLDDNYTKSIYTLDKSNPDEYILTDLQTTKVYKIVFEDWKPAFDEFFLSPLGIIKFAPMRRI